MLLKKTNTKVQKAYLILLLISIHFLEVIAQGQITQTVKGTVIDVTSKQQIIGATVIIENSNPTIGTVTDIEGNFRFDRLPLGRYNFRISSVGYEPQIVSDILVGSAKEVVLSIEMSESVHTLGSLFFLFKTRNC